MEYRQIHTCIWKDSWYIELRHEFKLLFIYLFSNERAVLTGLYDLSLKVVQFETDLEMDVILAGLAEFERAGKAFYQDGMVWVPTLLRHNARNLTSPKIQSHIKALIGGTRDCELKTRWIAYYNEMVDARYRIDRVSIPVRELDHDHDQEHEQEHEQDQSEPSADALPADAGGKSVVPPQTFQEWVELLPRHNGPALVRRMIELLYPGMDPPDYGQIGSIAKQMGKGANGYRRLMGLLWEYSARPPQGDVLPYLLRVHQGKENGRNGKHQNAHGTVDVPELATGFIGGGGVAGESDAPGVG